MFAMTVFLPKCSQFSWILGEKNLIFFWHKSSYSVEILGFFLLPKIRLGLTQRKHGFFTQWHTSFCMINMFKTDVTQDFHF